MGILYQPLQENQKPSYCRAKPNGDYAVQVLALEIQQEQRQTGTAGKTQPSARTSL